MHHRSLLARRPRTQSGPRTKKAEPEDRYGDVVVDTDASYEAYLEWVAMAPAHEQTPGNLRRPLWFARACRPADSAYLRD